MNYFLLLCPNCGKKMKYHSTTKILAGKRKKCVYCGTSFGVKNHLIKETSRL